MFKRMVAVNGFMSSVEGANGAKEVWIVNHYAVVPSMPGVTRHFSIAKEMVGRDIEVKIFAADRGNHNPSEPLERKRLSLATKENIEGIEFFWLRSKSYTKNDWRRGLNLLLFAVNSFLVNLFRHKPDLMIVSNPHLIAVAAGVLLARLRGIKVVVELRDIWPKALLELSDSRYQSAAFSLLELVEKYAYKNAYGFIAVSQGIVDYLRTKGVGDKEILLVPNGVDFNIFRESHGKQETRERLGLPLDRFIAMYVGVHGLANSLDTILDAAAMMSNDSPLFVLVGDGIEKRRLISLKKQKELDNVVFLGPYPKIQMPEVMECADALVITLRDVDVFKYGISPNKFFEYMAARKPIICAVGGEIGRVVENNKCGIAVRPEDPGELVSAVKFLAANPGIANEMAKNGYEYVRANNDWSELSQRVLRYLD